MKKIAVLGLALLALTACSNGASKTNASEGGKSSISSEKQASSSQKTPPSTDSKVHHNGSYYYVDGKYGQVVVVNKRYPLSSDYNPGEDATAKAELLKLIAAMQAEGFPISDQYSGFRSYQTQTSLYQDYVNRDGKAAADRYSARPGYSEHQTGYMPEQWHLRYIRQEAQDIADSGLSLEEYYGFAGGDYQ